ncbi:hypothetical protein TWF696_000719 [Orbilia brochopaga]|uniref:Ubiquitin carboxyl-terminal hydrolase n=1 Tax=Orbilia brochopaga TaxID=3140254 RepID=A0AAV9VDP5_9PEZI
MMDQHQHPQVPPQGPYIAPQVMGQPSHSTSSHQPRRNRNHHQNQNQQRDQHHQGSHPWHNPPIHYQHPVAHPLPIQHVPQYPPHPAQLSQVPDIRTQGFHASNRPVIVSTPTAYLPPYPPVMPQQATDATMRLQSQLHPGTPPFYPPGQGPFQPPADIPSPASLPQEPTMEPTLEPTSDPTSEPTSDPNSSPSRSLEATEEPNVPRYETPITSSSSRPSSPSAPFVIPMSIKSGFKPPRLPWFSAPGQPFPARKARTSKISSPSTDVQRQSQTQDVVSETPSPAVAPTPISNDQPLKAIEDNTTNGSNVARVETNGVVPATSEPSEDPVAPAKTPKTGKAAPRSTVPIPVVPFIPAIHKPRKSTENATISSPVESDKAPKPQEEVSKVPVEKTEEPAAKEASLPPAPKSWADLVRTTSSKTATTGTSQTTPSTNGTPATSSDSREIQGRPLADVLLAFNVPQQGSSRANWIVPMVEPRGLINTGNMCFMNSILQALLFCGPFYMFLDAISRNVTFSFRGETPLIDSMILFIREFRKLSAGTNNAPNGNGATDLTLAGTPFAPEYVYEAVRGLKRFSSMRRGHQQDAEEFLGFFLDVLHEESVAAMKAGSKTTGASSTHSRSGTATPEDDNSGWQEVNHKQKAVTTHTVDHPSGTSPITKIFGGQMRNELRVSGQRNSTTCQPYQSLQLDIQSNDVSNIVDALRQISLPEKLQGGDFKSARGATATATKQTFLEGLPPVLILHLKRFRYNDMGGTQKIWKDIGYPLEFDIPNEVLSPSRRSSSKPTYRLISVVYHHGKSATNGHYTVDVRRQDGWLRIDDTNVRRISEEDVSIDNSPHDREARRKNANGQENGWREVNAATKVRGRGPSTGRSPVKEDKVAYLLFYELL